MNAEGVGAQIAAVWGFNCGGGDYGGATFSSGSSGGANIGVTAALSYMVASGVHGIPLCLTGDETLTAYTYKEINTQLYIQYESKPTVSAVQEPFTTSNNTGTVQTSPMNGAVGSNTPVFAVSSTQDAGNGSAAVNYDYSVSSSSNMSSVVWTSGWTSSSTAQVPAAILQPGATYYWQATVQDQYGTTGASPVYSWVTSAFPTIPVGSVAVSPADNSVVASLTPNLTAPVAAAPSNAPGATLTYAIRIVSGSDGVTGQIAQSPPLTPSSGTVAWTVPQGLLQDGGSYTWVEIVSDGYDVWSPAVARLTVNLRVTSPGPSPTESAGPVTVDLGNGNVNASFTSPTVTTVGGAMGMAFNYNSQLAGNAGLNGTYYNVTPAPGTSPNFSFTSGLPAPALSRTDSAINFDWGTGGSPGPSLLSTDFMAQWTGYITPPNGSYTFGFQRDDGASLFLGGQQVLNQWSDNGGYAYFWGSTSPELVVSGSQATLTTASGTTNLTLPIPITAQYYQGAVSAHIALDVYNTTAGIASAQAVPANWFTKSVNVLPSGWAGSGALAGDADKYVSANNQGGSVIVTDTNGGTHTYTKTSTGGYTPPAGEGSTLTINQTNAMTLTDASGTVKGTAPSSVDSMG